MKRALDLALAGLGLLLSMPLVAVLAAAIRLDDGGPVFFRQTRVGKDGRHFQLWKLRTLHTGPKDPTRPDDHTTRLGPFLRTYALDELPQLWNVFCGDMSLVGPRPTLPDQTARYGAFEQTRLAVRPGLTGWAQIHGRNALSWRERIRLDVWYVENRSLTLDLAILVRTPAVLLRGTGVTGAQGRNAAFGEEALSPPNEAS